MKVNPVKVFKMQLSEVSVGDVFTFNRTKFIKLAECDKMEAISAITLNSIAYVDITKNKEISVEQKAFTEYMKFVRSHKHNDVVRFSLPDADMYRKYMNIIKPYINEAWYVDNGEYDDMYADEFFYVDKFADLHKGKPDKQIPLHTIEKLGVRAVYSIENYAEVYVEAN